MTHRHTSAAGRRRFLVTALAAILILPSFLTWSTGAEAESLGGGTYRIAATAFGTDRDGLVGEETASGHVLQANDRLVALPACTESSCPWLSLDSAVGDHWGPQTACAEADGLCWVEIVSLDTGQCAVAPVLDLGPLFVHDNWWASRENRSYRLSRGTPAAEAVSDGGDVGFGPGISDRGYDVEGEYGGAPGIDLGAGTWADLGLEKAQGLATVDVTLLWQAGIPHTEACGGGGDDSGGNASVVEDLNLRAGPSTADAILDVMPAGSRVTILGGSREGFFPVRHGGTPGWAAADYLASDSGAAAGTLAVVLETLNLRGGPSTSDSVLDVMPAGAVVALGGRSRDGFLAVSFAGTSGWAYADFLDAGDATFDGAAASGNSTVREDLNLRAGPSTGDDVLAVMPAGAAVTLTGERSDGFVSVEYEGRSGWAFAAYLSGPAGGDTATVTEAVNLRSGASTDDDVLDVLPAGAEVTLTGNGLYGFAEVIAGDLTGWAAGAYLSTGSGPLDLATRTVSEDLNLRAGPSQSEAVRLVMPVGATVLLTGPREHGYAAVAYDGREGWAAVEYLD